MRPEPGRGAGADDVDHALPAHVQGPGKEVRGVVSSRLGIAGIRPPRSARWPFGDRHGLAREGGLVHRQRVAGDQNAIGGKPLPFADKDEIARHEIARRDAPLDPAADHPGEGLRELAQGRERPLAPGFLQHHQPDRHDGAGHHEQALADVAEHQVKPRRGEQEQEHGLAQDPADDVDDTAGALFLDGVGPMLGEPTLRLGLVETRQARRQTGCRGACLIAVRCGLRLHRHALLS